MIIFIIAASVLGFCIGGLIYKSVQNSKSSNPTNKLDMVDEFHLWDEIDDN